MGASHSTLPPLVEVNAPGGKVLVPPGTAFTVHPPSYARSRSDPYTRGPIYTPCSPPRRGARPRPRPHPRFGGPDIDIVEGSEESESTLPDMMEGMSPRLMRRQTSKGYPGGMMGGGGMPGMGGMGRRVGLPGGFDSMNQRSRSAPEMQLGGDYPGMGGVPMGMPGSPRMGAMGRLEGMGNLGPGGFGGMGAMGAMGGMQPTGMPPEYTSNLSMPRFGVGGGMPGADMNPYAHPPGALSSQSSRSSPDPPQATRRPTGRKPRHYEHIPMGAYANAEKPRRSTRRPELPTSARLNRGQPSSKKVGPSGAEWLEGDNAWLDACTCTTGCNCRKSQRVLYRAQGDPHKGHDSGDDDGDEDHVLTSGEIRYILKTDLGRDCGDHSACKKSESSDSEKSQKSKKKKDKKEDKKEDKKRKDQFDEFKTDMLEALDERLQDFKKDSRQRDESASPARQPFGGPGIAPSAFMMNDMNMDPRMVQQMGMMAGDPFGAGRMPPGMTDLTGKRQMHPGMAMGGMGGMGGMAPNGMGGFENGISEMDGIGLMGNQHMQSGMMNKKSMRPNFMSHRGAKAGRQFSNGGMGVGMDMDMDMDQMAAMYAKSMGGGHGGMMMGGRAGGGGGGGRRAYLESESDDFDLGPGPSMRSGMRQQAGRDRAGRGSRRPVNQDEDIPNRRDFGGSPLGRNNDSQDRGKQPRVDTDDDDAY